MAEKVISQIKFEIEQIDQLLELYAELLACPKQNTPSLVEKTAMAALLHSFYTGVENIFLSVAKGIDRDIPAGAQSHRDLLGQMIKRTLYRMPAISEKVKEKLSDYLIFRHFFRHAYSFFLDWDKMKELVSSLVEVWDQLKRELHLFLDHLNPD
ncbi:hypothetical protein KJ693_12320 [bacterium]|nr:hypothetical protein [bacterium]MBU1616077.1 hypothetical protein [bacterium]